VVIKGSARAAPGELAYHLLREDTNELVSVLELRGVASLDLRGALAELDGMGAGSRSGRTLYHASINTPVPEQLDPQQQRIARERLAERMGLAGQPFAMVQHIKHGRQHTHIVWSRIDVETGRAIPDSHNYRKHEEVSRELERVFGHGHVLGAHVRDKAKEPRPERGPTWGEQRQAERSGLTPAEAKQKVTALWRRAATGAEFCRQLEAEGFLLVRGDRRDFVLIDRSGEVHGLSRRIEGVKATAIRERLADIDVTALPDVEEARQQQRRRGQEREVEPVFVGTAERIRARENKAEASTAAPPLSHTDQEAADALRSLQRTMRAQAEAIVKGMPVAAERRQLSEQPRRPVSKPEVIQAPEDRPVQATKPETAEPEPRREARKPSWLRRLIDRVKGRAGEEPEPEPATAETRMATPNAPEKSAPERRPSAHLMVLLFGVLVDAYQRAFDRAQETVRAEPAARAGRDRPENDLFAAAVRRAEQADAKQRLRDQETRPQRPRRVRGHDRDS
jgi:hypothetical protein